MIKKSTFKERILQYLEIKGITKYEFYQKTGVSNGTLSQNGGLGEENILKFISYYRDISSDWFLFGKGDIFHKTEEKPPENIQINNRQCRTVQNNFAKNSASEPPAEYGNSQLTIQSLHNTIEAQQHTIEAQQRTINTQQELIDLLKKQLSE